MKKWLIGVLVCLNLALVVILVFHAGPPRAYAQRRGVANYILVAGQIDDTQQIVYVIDPGRRMLGAFRLDTSRPEWHWQPSLPRDLSRDFPIKRR